MAWSDAAREAAELARKAHAASKEVNTKMTDDYFKDKSYSPGYAALRGHEAAAKAHEDAALASSRAGFPGGVVQHNVSAQYHRGVAKQIERHIKRTSGGY